VSVVVTTYNQARYLAEALDSVVAQTVPVDEVIVVDDGSEDGPERVVAAFAGVRVIRQANRGLSAARNRGLEAARGRYLVFLDADDRLLPEAIASGLRCLEANPDCGLAYGAYHSIDEGGRHIRTYELRETGRDAFGPMLPGNMIGMHATVVYRREALEAVGGFDTALKACEDFDIFLRIALRYPFASHRDHVAEYRHHQANMSRQHALMLEQGLAVLAKQKSNARSRLDWWVAFCLARTSFKQHYARQAVGELHRLRATRQLSGRAIRDFFAMLRLAPVAMARAAWESARER